MDTIQGPGAPEAPVAVPRLWGADPPRRTGISQRPAARRQHAIEEGGGGQQQGGQRKGAPEVGMQGGWGGGVQLQAGWGGGMNLTCCVCCVLCLAACHDLTTALSLPHIPPDSVQHGSDEQHHGQCGGQLEQGVAAGQLGPGGQVANVQPRGQAHACRESGGGNEWWAGAVAVFLELQSSMLGPENACHTPYHPPYRPLP